jgi:uncharacterized protein (TIGR02594 family)
MEITAFDIAQRFIGIKEMGGNMNNPQIMAMLQLDNGWPKNDEVPWCSAFVNYICWLLRLPRSKSLAARSWLGVGQKVRTPIDAVAGFDIVVLSRGGGEQPGPEVLDAPGHVGFFAGYSGSNSRIIDVLGGNQNDSVNVSKFDTSRILDIRRLA